MAAKRILLTLAAASLALVAWLAWKPASFPTHTAQAETSAHEPAPPIAAGSSQRPDFTKTSPQRVWFLALKQRADAGDPASQRLLAQAYERCMVVNQNAGNPNVEQYEEQIQRRIQSAETEEEATLLGHLLQHVLQECAAVEGGAPIDWEDMRLLYVQAAQGGDLPARVTETLFNLQQPLGEVQAAALLEDVLASNDPAAVFALGGAIGESRGMQVAEPYTPLAEGWLAGRAWQVAAAAWVLTADQRARLPAGCVCTGAGLMRALSSRPHVDGWAPMPNAKRWTAGSRRSCARCHPPQRRAGLCPAERTPNHSPESGPPIGDILPLNHDPGWICPMRFTAAASSLVVLLSMASTVSAAEPDIFGIKLGAPLALPLCQISLPAPAAPKSNKGMGARTFNKLMTPPPEPPKATPPATGLCVAPGTTNMAVGNTEFAAGEYGYLVFATDEFPAWVAPIGMAIGAGADDVFSLEGAGGLVLLRNGRVIALRFNTTGFEAQPRVMELLKRKFGSPSSQKAVTWNNDLGGSRESISAQWRKPDFFADYSSVVQSQPMRAQGLSGGIGFLSIGNDLGRQVLQPAASKEAEF